MTKNQLELALHPSFLVQTERLILVPFTLEILEEISQNSFSFLDKFQLKAGKNWPDEDFKEALPRMIKNLQKVDYPTGFENWIMIKKETNEIIGDLGFKGFNFVSNSCDIGYAIIENERRKGYAKEACQGLIHWVWETDPSILITASTLPDNLASIQLLQSLNFQKINQDELYLYWELSPKTSN